MKKRILIYTCMWKRYSISRLFAIGITRFMRAVPEWAEVSVFVCFSEDASVLICDEFGFRHVKHDNSPLGRKWNYGLQYAIEHFDFDYVMIMGDDDLIADEAWMHFEKVLTGQPSPTDYFGFNSIYFLSAERKIATQFCYSKAHAVNKLIGCGRVVSRRAIEMVAWHTDIKMIRRLAPGFESFASVQAVPYYQAQYFINMKRAVQQGWDRYFSFWDDEQMEGLDGTSEINLLMNGFPPAVILTERPMMTDVKSHANIHAIEKYLPLGEKVEADACMWFMSEEEKLFLNETFQQRVKQQ